MQILLFIYHKYSTNIYSSQVYPISKSIELIFGKTRLIADIAFEKWEKILKAEKLEWVDLAQANAWELFVLNAKFCDI